MLRTSKFSLWRKGNKPFCTVSGYVNWYSHYGNSGFSQKLKTELHMIQKFHSWVFIQRKQKLIRKAICTPLFIAALFTTVKIWKEPKCCPSIEEWMKKMYDIYIYIHTYIHIHMYTHTYTPWNITQPLKE